MIPYVEILDKYTLKAFTQVEPSECWFELSYYEVGECEIYCIANKHNLDALQKDVFVKIPNKRYVWVITSIDYIFNVNGARMIVAKGYEAKWILNKRVNIIPIDLSNTNISTAIYRLLYRNIINPNDFHRKIDYFDYENQVINITFDNLQAPRENLLDFINKTLKTYNIGSTIYIENDKLYFSVINGTDRSGLIVFSQSHDNLISSTYNSNDEGLKTFALVVSKIDEVDYIQDYDLGDTGIDRNELVVNSNLSTKYTDEQGQEQEADPTSSLFIGWQIEEGKNELANNKATEELNGEIDIINSNYVFDRDYFIGDLVKIKDEYFNYENIVRVLKITFTQTSTYGEEIKYGGE